MKLGNDLGKVGWSVVFIVASQQQDKRQNNTAPLWQTIHLRNLVF
jgi:hypothetical protein